MGEELEHLPPGMRRFNELHLAAQFFYRFCALATAMAAVLLIAVLVVYWLYNRIVGIDNMRLG